MEGREGGVEGKYSIGVAYSINVCMYVCKMEGRGEEVEGEVWSTQQCCRDAPYVQYTLLQTDRQTTL